MNLSRRHFLASTSAAVAVGTALMVERSAFSAAAETEPTVLRVSNRIIEVNGKAAKVYGLVQPGDSAGIVMPAGRFRIRLESQIDARRSASLTEGANRRAETERGNHG